MLYNIVTFGCQMNVHESEKIAGLLRAEGYSETDDIRCADAVVFNTCCIRDNAENKAMGRIGALKSLKKARPDMIISVVGCMSQKKGTAELLRAKFPFIDVILGTHNIDKLGGYINQIRSKRIKVTDIADTERPAINEDVTPYRTGGAHAYINIMYGCDNFCTYCIVPYVRGRERSRGKNQIVGEFKRLISEGYKEITLLGQNVNSYAGDNGKTDFADLLTELSEIRGDHRIFFMTSHPKDLSMRVIDAVAKYDNICNYIHLPVQSGSNRILKSMNRRYTREYYLELVDNIRAKIPNCRITTDIMVGFPCESEDDFCDTLDLVDKVRFSGAFTFVYSPRSGTPASEMPQIPEDVKTDRIMRLIEKQNAITAQISAEYVGGTYRILCDGVSKNDAEIITGRTDCGRLVQLRGRASDEGKFIDVVIEKYAQSVLSGRRKEI